MRRPDREDLVQVGIPVLIEAVAVTIMIACSILLVAVLASPVPV
jgi:hypothetical protein